MLQVWQSEKILVMVVVEMVSLLSRSVVQRQQHFVIIIMCVIRMSHVIVLIVMKKQITVVLMEQRSLFVPKILHRHVIAINFHTVSQHVSMGILGMQVGSVWLLVLLQLLNHYHVLFVEELVQKWLQRSVTLERYELVADVRIRAQVVHIDGPISQLLQGKLQLDIQLLPTMVGLVQLVLLEPMLKHLPLVVQV